jgi:hypothetical protein
MKRNSIILLAVLCLLIAVVAMAKDPPGSSEVAIGFRGGSVWTSGTSGICIWYLPVVGDLGPGDLFSDSVVDKQHAYLIWVSDWSVDILEGSPLFLAFAHPGAATIYHTDKPESRNFADLEERSTWGEPVATFMRKASLLRSDNGGETDTFFFSAKLVSSRGFTLNGKHFNFANLVPNGMTCFEYGDAIGGIPSTVESGTCVAIGAAGQ